MKVKAILVISILGYFFSGSSGAARTSDYFLPKPGIRAAAVILGGAAAGKEYTDRIRTWALRLHDILTGDYGYRSEQIVLLMGPADPNDARISGPLRRETIEAQVKALKNTLEPGDMVYFFLLGHGTSDGKEAKFVIFGPDITGQEFAALLDNFSEQDVVIVNATSSSYPFCVALSGPGRVVISATRSGAEKYDTIFAEYFIDALAGRSGDRDKNRRVSMWEAFLYAERKVEKWYTDRKRIPTEHAVIDDNGDGIFSMDPDPPNDDGKLAQIAYLDLLLGAPASELAAGADASLVQQLTARVRELERSVFLLRNRKAEMPAEEYQHRLEMLLIELSRNAKNLRRILPTIE